MRPDSEGAIKEVSSKPKRQKGSLGLILLLSGVAGIILALLGGREWMKADVYHYFRLMDFPQGTYSFMTDGFFPSFLVSILLYTPAFILGVALTWIAYLSIVLIRKGFKSENS